MKKIADPPLGNQRIERELKEQIRATERKFDTKSKGLERQKGILEERVQAREDRVRLDFAQDLNLRARRKQGDWERWCRSKKQILQNVEKGTIVEGERRFTEQEMMLALEVLRRADPDNETVCFGWASASSVRIC